MKFKRMMRTAVVIGASAALPLVALALEPFRNTVTGDVLDLNTAPKEGRDTEGVKIFLSTGINPYNGVDACLVTGEQSYLSSCSGCHGHLAEGKVGPGLNDDYWTYTKNKTDKGLFETIFGGARSMMGPHNDLPIDETLRIMAWIRHLYTGPTEDADWLNPEQKKTFKPFVEVKGETHKAPEGAKCEPPAASN